MLVDATLGFLNHLLDGEDWARERLRAFYGQTARFELGALTLPLEITSAGLFAVGDKNSPTSVTIVLPADAPLRALTDRPSLFTAAHISGSAELAETLGFIFRNLRWDAESDLSRLVGDIAARRLISGGRQLVQWQQNQARNLALNLAEYFTEESPAIARQPDVSTFCTDVESVQEELCRLEKRVALLEA